MTQQPPSSPEQPENVSQPTAPLWQGQGQPPAYSPVIPAVSPQPGADPQTQPFAKSAEPTKTRRIAELAVVAMIAAILASAGTYGLTHSDAAPAATTPNPISMAAAPAPVKQANASNPNWSVTAGVVSPSVVSITVTGSSGTAQGSGVIYDTAGHILTNNHVVVGGGSDSTLTVTLNDERTFGATVVGTDPSTDLAVIKLTNGPANLTPISLGSTSTLKVGDPVMAIGNPLGLAGTVTTGIVSALNRPVSTSDQSEDPTNTQTTNPVVTNAIQTSAAINPGNSGGALVNASGQLVGINSAIASLGSSTDSSSESGSIGIGFAIPVNEARLIASQLIASGTAVHPYLGVSVTDGVVTDGSSKRAAAVLGSVVSGSPSEQAGLKAGDAIVAVDGNPIDGSLSLVAQIHEFTVGNTVKLTVVRNGQPSNINVTLAAETSQSQ
jgi:putative serine protease PepD